jgi:hypothetical protein
MTISETSMEGSALDRFYYRNSIDAFLNEEEPTILGKLARANSFNLVSDQRNAWLDEIRILKNVLPGLSGDVVFEYAIPRLGKRIDVVVLTGGCVFCLEFKCGADEYLYADKEQVWDYALELKHFHEPSRDLPIIPVLVATDAERLDTELEVSQYDDMVAEPLLCNAVTLEDALRIVPPMPHEKSIDGWHWVTGRYSPTPTIIQAASALYAHHNVVDITRNDAGDNLERTTRAVLDIIEQTKQRGEKAICFITGVPGAGKTLVGLNVAIEQFKQHKESAVYLSGNQPLVSVLSEALARDDVRRAQERGETRRITEARDKVKSFIQIIHHYRDNTLSKVRLPIVNGQLEIDPIRAQRHRDDGYAEVEHVAIFDEAQRLWDQRQLKSWLARKKNIQQFPMSESEFLIWSLNLREDWAVVICLVGGGQEINSGEAGIQEPIRVMNERFPDWHVYLSNNLSSLGYAGPELDHLLRRTAVVHQNPDLHLAVSMRSYRAETLARFVNRLLERDAAEATKEYKLIREKYPIVLTRDIEVAKEWLRKRAKTSSHRYGLVVSSQAYRLRPLAIDVRAKPDIKHWFLDDISDIRSSLFLEDVCTEFDIQGLELDWVGLIWDGDFRYSPDGWVQSEFKGNQWQRINQPVRKSFQLNAYRVLLTRARQGMVICVPEGNVKDPTRQPAFYDSTYEYLKSIGLPEIE